MSEASTWYQLNHGRPLPGMIPLCLLAGFWQIKTIDLCQTTLLQEPAIQAGD